MPATSCFDSQDNSAQNNRGPSVTHHRGAWSVVARQTTGHRICRCNQCLGLQRLRMRKDVQSRKSRRNYVANPTTEVNPCGRSGCH